jgi:hypothetical protein
MGFTTALVVEQVRDFDWKLTKALRYRGNRDPFVVPKDFETDFASVPKIFQWLIPTSGRYTKPAVLHDFLCQHGDDAGCSIEDADGIFRRSMHEVGVPFLTRWVMWAAVRWRSLLKSWFRAGPEDLPQMVLVTVAPGVFVVFGGLIVIALLLGWFVIEIVATLLLALVKWLMPPVRDRTKTTVRPNLPWTA